MKKIRLYIIISVLIISALIVADYLNAKYNGTKPLIAIKSTNEEQQVIIYYGLFFKTCQCTAEENNYTTLTYFTKTDLDTFCPKSFKIKFEDGYFITSKNVKITKEQLEYLTQFYNAKEIDQMTSEELDKAINDTSSNWIPIKKQ